MHTQLHPHPTQTHTLTSGTVLSWKGSDSRLELASSVALSLTLPCTFSPNTYLALTVTWMSSSLSNCPGESRLTSNRGNTVTMEKYNHCQIWPWQNCVILSLFCTQIVTSRTVVRQTTLQLLYLYTAVGRPTEFVYFERAAGKGCCVECLTPSSLLGHLCITIVISGC